MAKKRESKKKRAASEDSNDGNTNVMSKFSEFEMEAPPSIVAADGAPLPHPADFVPTLHIVTAEGVAVAMAAAPSERAPIVSDDLVPLHLIQGLAPQSVVVTPGSIASSVTVPGGLVKEPDAPKVKTRVTVEGAPPPAMRLELINLLS